MIVYHLKLGSNASGDQTSDECHDDSTLAVAGGDGPHLHVRMGALRDVVDNGQSHCQLAVIQRVFDAFHAPVDDVHVIDKILFIAIFAAEFRVVHLPVFDIMVDAHLCHL